MAKARFKGTVLAGHKQAAIEVPFDPAERWGVGPTAIRRGRYGFAVRATLGGIVFESHVVARMKKWWLLVEDEHLAAAGLQAGDDASVALEPA